MDLLTIYENFNSKQEKQEALTFLCQIKTFWG